MRPCRLKQKDLTMLTWKILFSLTGLLLLFNILHLNRLSRIAVEHDMQFKAWSTMIPFNCDSVPSTNSSSIEVKKTTPPNKNTTLALCTKSLFGNIDLTMVIQWCHYHHLLGFDHIFLSYLPELAKHPRLHELKALSFVTIFQNDEAQVQTVIKDGKPYKRLAEGSLNQQALEAKCLQEDAVDYTWVMWSDPDEYLWLSEPVDLHTFVDRYSHLSYMSFGKIIYSASSKASPNLRNNTNASRFRVADFPYSAGVFCRNKYHGVPNSYCPTFLGRSKVLVRPKRHKALKCHGNILKPEHVDYAIHWDLKLAHMKEWPAVHVIPQNRTPRLLRQAKRSPAYEKHEPAVYQYQIGLRVKRETKVAGTDSNETNKLIPMVYDDTLKAWFDGISERRR